MKPNDTVDVAQKVGDLSLSPSVQVLGAIGNGPAGAADVDWYEFTLDRPAQVVLTASPQKDSPNFHPVLSLYNNDPFDFQDLYDPTGASPVGPGRFQRSPGAGVHRRAPLCRHL